MVILYSKYTYIDLVMFVPEVDILQKGLLIQDTEMIKYYHG